MAPAAIVTASTSAASSSATVAARPQHGVAPRGSHAQPRRQLHAVVEVVGGPPILETPRRPRDAGGQRAMRLRMRAHAERQGDPDRHDYRGSVAPYDARYPPASRRTTPRRWHRAPRDPLQHGASVIPLQSNALRLQHLRQRTRRAGTRLPNAATESSINKFPCAPRRHPPNPGVVDFPAPSVPHVGGRRKEPLGSKAPLPSLDPVLRAAHGPYAPSQPLFIILPVGLHHDPHHPCGRSKV